MAALRLEVRSCACWPIGVAGWRARDRMRVIVTADGLEKACADLDDIAVGATG